MNKEQSEKLKSTPTKTLIYDIGIRLGETSAQIGDLKIHFTNHLHNHIVDRLLQVLYTLLVIGMFCYLKWGK